MVRRNEEVSVNDWFLKNANKYIINKDMDEMIVPSKENNYHEMMDMIEETTQSQVCKIFWWWTLTWPRVISTGRSATMRTPAT